MLHEIEVRAANSSFVGVLETVVVTVGTNCKINTTRVMNEIAKDFLEKGLFPVYYELRSKRTNQNSGKQDFLMSVDGLEDTSD